MNAFVCQDCDRSFSSAEVLNDHIRAYEVITPMLEYGPLTDCSKELVQDLFRKLKNALTHTDERSPSPLTDGGDISSEGDVGGHLCPHPKCDTKVTKRWNLSRHFNQHIKTKERCPICKKTCRLQSQLIWHVKACSKEKGESEDTDLATECVKRLNKLASRRLSDQLSVHSDEIHRPRKRQRMDGTISEGASPADRIESFDVIHKGGNIDGIRSQIVAPSTASTNHTTEASLVEARSVSSRNVDQNLSHSQFPKAPFSNYNLDESLHSEIATSSPFPRAPFPSTYNMDESQHRPDIATNSQYPKAPFLSRYNMDESQPGPEFATNSQYPKAPFLSRYNMDESQPGPEYATDSQIPRAPFLLGYNVDESRYHSAMQTHQAMPSHPVQIISTPHVSVHELSLGAIDGNQIGAQAASDRGRMYGSLESVQYPTVSGLYADSNLGAAPPVEITQFSYTS